MLQRTCFSMFVTAGCSLSQLRLSDAWRAAVAADSVVPDSSASCCSSNHRGVANLRRNRTQHAQRTGNWQRGPKILDSNSTLVCCMCICVCAGPHMQGGGADTAGQSHSQCTCYTVAHHLLGMNMCIYLLMAASCVSTPSGTRQML